MSTYLNKSFGAAAYAKYRPTYPPRLFEYIRSYREKHANGEKPELSVDLACGTGQATAPLGDFSEKVVGVDFSEGMVEEARVHFGEKFSFEVGSDKTLTKLFEPRSVDLLTVAEAAHWFEYPTFWEQAATVLKPQGTLAIFSYWTFSFPDYPVVADIIHDYAYAEDKCGPYWDPGREVLNKEYIELKESIPKDKFKDIEYRTNKFDKLRPEEPFELIKEDVPVEVMINLLKTWSPYFNWKNANPGEPDIADGVMVNITKNVGLKPEDKVTVKWNTVFLLATRA